MEVSEILGRRFDDMNSKVRLRFGRRLSLTVIGVNVERNDCYVHWSNGAKEHLSLREVMKAIGSGKMVESIGAPFVWPRDDRQIVIGV